MPASLSPQLFLTVGSPNDAAVQLFYKLPGQYRLVRHSQYSYMVNGTNLPYRDFICPSHGTSSVTIRAPSDSDYEMELLQTTTINLRTRSGQSATQVEKRAFRIKNGQWSLWSVDEFDNVSKLANLMMGEVREQERVGPSETDFVQKVALYGGPWPSALGHHAVKVWVWVGRQLYWQDVQLVVRPRGAENEVFTDEFWPLVAGSDVGDLEIQRRVMEAVAAVGS